MTQQIPRAVKGTTCPFNSKDVSTVCHKCALWTQIRGKDPQTGDMIDKWACAIALMPILTIENSGQQRHTAAAVESFRNEMVNANQNTTALMLAQQQRPMKLISE